MESRKDDTENTLQEEDTTLLHSGTGCLHGCLNQHPLLH